MAKLFMMLLMMVIVRFDDTGSGDAFGNGDEGGDGDDSGGDTIGDGGGGN